jgi:hypothetical protein
VIRTETAVFARKPAGDVPEFARDLREFVSSRPEFAGTEPKTAGALPETAETEPESTARGYVGPTSGLPGLIYGRNFHY